MWQRHLHTALKVEMLVGLGWTLTQVLRLGLRGARMLAGSDRAGSSASSSRSSGRPGRCVGSSGEGQGCRAGMRVDKPSACMHVERWPSGLHGGASTRAGGRQAACCLVGSPKVLSCRLHLAGCVVPGVAPGPPHPLLDTTAKIEMPAPSPINTTHTATHDLACPPTPMCVPIMQVVSLLGLMSFRWHGTLAGTTAAAAAPDTSE